MQYFIGNDSIKLFGKPEINSKSDINGVILYRYIVKEMKEQITKAFLQLANNKITERTKKHKNKHFLTL